MIKDQKEWLDALREVALLEGAPVQQKDGKWEVQDRKKTWKAMGARITDGHLDRIRSVATEVLTEIDPQFELEPSERFASAIHGKVLKHSKLLRNGLAETLALLGSDPQALTSCSTGKAEGTAVLAVREILKDADWLRWASLNDCLPSLAEAAPSEFLFAIEKSLQKSPSPFVKIFGQETGGFAGRNYLTGTLWSLETLAWSADYLTQVTVILGELAAIDPGGNWGNRPANSLADIFLPWHPQTIADIPRRKAAIDALLREQPNVGWRLLLNLLPNQMSTTSGSYKPSWRNFIPSDWSETVTQKDYWEQVSAYAERALNLAKTDLSRLTQLIDHLPNLSPPTNTRLLEYVASPNVTELPDEDRRAPWEALISLAAKHRKFPDATWTMKSDVIDQIEEIAIKISPKASEVLARRLFAGRDWDLYDEMDNYEGQQEIVNQKRQEATQTIFKKGGFSAVLNFAREVESPWKVGVAFGQIALEEEDANVLPQYLSSEEKPIRDFAGGFVMGRFIKKQWAWVDSLSTKDWTPAQQTEFLTTLPFGKESWSRAEKTLKNDAALYWKDVNAFQLTSTDEMLEATERFLQFNRPQAAIEYMSHLLHKKVEFRPESAVRALLDRLKTDEKNSSHDLYAIEELIQWLQEHPPTDEKDLFQVEWAYLPVLGSNHGAKPKTLARALATSPAFFHEVIQAAFRSDKTKKENYQPTPEQQNMAKNAYRLLHEWSLVPGTQSKDTFDGAAFNDWLSKVRSLGEQSGHLSIAMHILGQVLPFTPSDPNGLWIHMSVAEALNAKEAEEMRSGFINKLFNLRGVHWATGGKSEMNLAEMNHKKANALDEKGFQRIAAAVRDFAKSYEREAERESKRDPLRD